MYYNALQLREGHFFKTFSDVKPVATAAPEMFSQWCRTHRPDAVYKHSYQFQLLTVIHILHHVAVVAHGVSAASSCGCCFHNRRCLG